MVRFAMSLSFERECTQLGLMRMCLEYGAMATVLGNPPSRTTASLAMCAALCDASLGLAHRLCQMSPAIIVLACYYIQLPTFDIAPWLPHTWPVSCVEGPVKKDRHTGQSAWLCSVS